MNKRIVLDLNSPKTKKRILIAIILLGLLIAAATYYMISAEQKREVLAAEEQLTSTEEESDVETATIYVDISGAVNQPSVLVLPEGSRIYEAIEAAGGLTADASLANINRAEILEDGAYLYVPTKQELEQEETVPISAGNNAGSAGSTGQGKININTADSDTLQQLNGVGPATAQKIIDYRNTSGKFKKIEDLKNVSGIGEKTFEKLASYIKV